MIRKRTLTHERVLSALLLVVFVVGQVRPAFAGIESIEVTETTNFQDLTPVTRSSGAAAGKAGGSGTHKAPVSSSGALTDGVTFDMPPGRLGMTPSLGLSYDSGSARSDSPVGAGWKLGLPTITRSHKHGFPAVRRPTDHVVYVPIIGFPADPRFGNPVYDDDKAIFEGPSGELGAVNDGPSDATRVFAPVRERSAVRYEYLPEVAGGAWIEHLPSGVKRYYGRDPVTLKEARITNELGTDSWLLVSEVDKDGNSIDYTYSHIEEQARATLSDAQRVPLFSRVEWGGNRTTKLGHAFYAQATETERECTLDAVHGHVKLCASIDHIDIGTRLSGSDVAYWTYALGYTRSADTGRLLLTKVTRKAPGEADTSTTFAYSGNPNGVPVFDQTGSDLPGLQGLYAESAAFNEGRFQFDGEPSMWRAINPQGYRSGFKFLDIDGNGEVDVVYHPAGMRAGGAALVSNDSRLQVGGGFYRPSAALPNGAGGSLGLPWNDFSTTVTGGGDPPGGVWGPIQTDIADVDGDGDLDSVQFPSVAYSDPLYGPLFGSDHATYGLQVWENTAKKSGQTVPPLRPVLEQWPSPAFQGVEVMQFQVDVGVVNGPKHKEYVWRPIPIADVYAPLQDVNGDGKADIVLLKYQHQFDPWDAKGPLAGGYPQGIPPKPGPTIPNLPIRAAIAGLAPMMDIGAYTPATAAAKFAADQKNTAQVLATRQSLIGTVADPPPQPFPSVIPKLKDVGEAYTLPANAVPGSNDVVMDKLAPAHVLRELTENELEGVLIPVTATLPPCPSTNSSMARMSFSSGDTPPIVKPPPAPYPCDPAPASFARAAMSSAVATPADAAGGVILPPWIPPTIPPAGPVPGRGPNGVPLPTTSTGGPIRINIPWPRSGPTDRPDPDGPPIFSHFPDWFPGGPPWFPPWLIGRGGPQEHQFLVRTNYFDPRVYVSGGTDKHSFDVEMSAAQPGVQESAFGESLRDLLNGGRTYPCGNDVRCLYPFSVSFNSFLQDVNGDGLVDLIVANVPGVIQTTAPNGQASTPQRVCYPGHRVFINRGYRFEPLSGSIDGAPWSGPTSQVPAAGGRLPLNKPVSPLYLLRNRDGVCDPMNNGLQVTGGANGDYTLPISSALDPYWDRLLPMSTMAPVDINADGRVDMVFAYRSQNGSVFDPRPCYQVSCNNGPIERAVFLNTPTGWLLVDPSFLPPVSLTGPGWKTVKATAQPIWPDAARFVDIDNDGLVDAVESGWCPAVGPLDIGNPQANCRPPHVYRNLGVVPDLLTSRVTSAGAWMSADYAPATGVRKGATVGTSGDARPGQMVVAHVRRGRFGDTRSELVTLSYNNFVRDHASTEAIGFESVSATYQNDDGTTYTENDQYAVGATTPLSDSSTSPVRHLLKGEVIQSTAAAGNHVTTTKTVFQLTRLGDGVVRMRPATTTVETCEQGLCTKTAAVTTAWDAESGAAMRTESGNFDGTRVVDDAERLVTSTTYRPNSRARAWVLGEPLTETETGRSLDFQGGSISNAVLSSRSWVRYPNGDVQEEHLSFGAAACASAPSESVISFVYAADGLPTQVSHAGKQTVTITYDSPRLAMASESSTVSRYADGVAAGTTTLTASYAVDYRHGERTTSSDPNGITTQAAFDSFGRSLWSKGPGGHLLEQSTYVDSYPASITSTVYTGNGSTSFQRKVHLDGDGRTLGVVEGNGTADVPYVRKIASEFDAWGRRVRVRLPAVAANLDDYRVTSDGRVASTTYDALDRPLAVTNPDGTQTTFAYEAPRISSSTSPRGYKTRRYVDGNGAVVAVERLGDHDAVVARHTIDRDAIGRIVRITDADGNVRNVERDGAGRIVRLNLPHRATANAGTFLVCNDQDGLMVEAQTPEGRHAVVRRDELGRSVVTTTTQGSSTSRTTLSYDDPNASFGIGRLTSVHDGTGTYTHDYDFAGHLEAVSFAPSADILSASPAIPAILSASFQYDMRGQLNRVNVPPLAGGFRFDVAYDHDARGRPTRITTTGYGLGPWPGAPASGDFAQLASGVSYDADNRMTDVMLGNGTFTHWAYSPLANRLDSIEHFDAAHSSIGRVAYTYDPNGNIATEERRVGSSVLASKEHHYDPLDRLASSSLFVSASGGVDQAETYALSPGGNLLSVELADSQYTETTGYSYDAAAVAQAVTAVTSTNSANARLLQYDRDGALLHETRDGEARSLAYDAAGCLTHVEATGGTASSTEYRCGFDGRTAYRRTTAGGKTNTRLDFAGLLELRPEKGVAVLRVPLQGGVTVEVARSLTTGAIVPDESRYLHTDIRGSVLATTSFDAPGNVALEDAEYDAWGRTMTASKTSAPTHQYANFEPDPGLDYYHFGPRLYDPTLRRWLSPDPLVLGAPSLDEDLGDQLNVYQYAGNNPVTHTDTNGQWVETAWDVANVAMDCYAIHSWDENTSTLSKVADVGGLIVDSAAVILPAVPGGAGAALKSARAAEKTEQALVNTHRAQEAAESVRHSEQAAQEAHRAEEIAQAAKKAEQELAEAKRVEQQAAEAKKAAEKTADETKRAEEIHSKLEGRAQRSRTTAVGSGRDAAGNPVTLVGKSGRSLTPAQRAALKEGEAAVKGTKGVHGEAAVVKAAEKAGVKLEKVGASRPICQDCQRVIREHGAEPVGRLKPPPKNQ